MATLNRIARIFTHEGAPAKRIDAVAQLERSVMSCLLWEDEFYEGGQTIGQRIAALVKEVPVAEVARVCVKCGAIPRGGHQVTGGCSSSRHGQSGEYGRPPWNRRFATVE